MVWTSRHFKQSEFACRCCGLSVPDPGLVDLLDRLRDSVGLPVVVTSGTRCQVHNDTIGGSEKSLHVPRHDTGGLSYAADIMVPGASLESVYGIAVGLVGLDRGGLEVGVTQAGGAWLHVDERVFRWRAGRVRGEWVTIWLGLREAMLLGAWAPA